MILQLLVLGLEQGMFRDILWDEQYCSQHGIRLLGLAKCLPSSLQPDGINKSAKEYSVSLPGSVNVQIGDTLPGSFF